MSFEIKLELSEFKRSEFQGHVYFTGPIWIEINKFHFPDYFWFDFPVEILSWWLNDLKPMYKIKQNSCEMTFKDGPFEFHIWDKNWDDWQVKFFQRTSAGNKIIKVDYVSPEELKEELVSAANNVLNFCKEKKWESKDLKFLKEITEKYK